LCDLSEGAAWREVFLGDGSEVDVLGEFDHEGFFFDRIESFQFADASQTVWSYGTIVQQMLAAEEAIPNSVIYGLKTLRVLARFRLDGTRGRWPLLRRPASVITTRRPPRAGLRSAKRRRMGSPPRERRRRASHRT